MSSEKAHLLTIPPELEGEMTPAVRAFVEALLDRIAELERGRPTPQNSSLPPSTQHPHAKPPGKKPSSARRRGGQPGHVKHQRPLLPSEQCDAVHVVKPPQCRRCDAPLRGDDPQPLRHQVWELPEIKPHVTEYQLHRLECAHCGQSTCAPLPPGVPASQAGPRLVALVALLMAYFRQSKRRTALFLETILGQPCCAAWTVKLQKQATAALRPAHEELVAALPAQSQLGIDESPHKEGTQKAWLWTFVAARFTVFALRLTRAATVLTEHLTNRFQGVVMCDRAKMYWSTGRLQWCWAHLKRDFQALIESHGAPEETGPPRQHGKARETLLTMLKDRGRLVGHRD